MTATGDCWTAGKKAVTTLREENDREKSEDLKGEYICQDLI